MGKHLQALVVPIITFVLGVILQTLLQKWLDGRDTVLLTLMAVTIGIVTVLIILVYFLSSVGKRFDSISEMLADVARRAGLSVEYIQDGNQGRSYKRATELVQQAETSLSFVDYWTPYQAYQAKGENISISRSAFYSAVKTQIDAHKADSKTFHRRIVQVAPELMDKHIPFETDPEFADYLVYTAKVQQDYPNSCRIKLASAHIRMPFIMVDQRYVVLPILTSDSDTRRQTRHGALVFDDRQGNLIQCLMSIYRVIDAHAKPMEVELLKQTESLLQGPKVLP